MRGPIQGESGVYGDTVIRAAGRAGSRDLDPGTSPGQDPGTLPRQDPRTAIPTRPGPTWSYLQGKLNQCTTDGMENNNTVLINRAYVA